MSDEISEAIAQVKRITIYARSLGLEKIVDVEQLREDPEHLYITCSAGDRSVTLRTEIEVGMRLLSAMKDAGGNL